MSIGSEGVLAAAVRHVIFPLWARREHPHFAASLKLYERSQFFGPEKLQALQREQLRKLLQHATEYCPFYKNRLKGIGFDAQATDLISRLKDIPLLTKTDIQRNAPAILATNFKESDRIRNQTGGSTGSPLQFFVDRTRLDSRMASTVRHDEWAGLLPGDWCAYLWGARLDQITGAGGWWNWCRKNLLYRRVELNTSLIREEDWGNFLRELRAKRPRKMIAYAQAAVLFAQYVNSRGIRDIGFDSMITTAEILLPEHRSLLEQTFGGKVFNRYGCREVSVIASECAEHSGLHVNAEALLVEIVATPGISAPAGKVVVTDLLNFSMPLIRYEIGDVAMWATDQECRCGRKLPLLTDIQGRTTDFLVLPDGRRISGPSLTLVVADMSDVSQVQFVQTSRNAITLRVVPGKHYGESTKMELRKRLGLYIGGTADMDILEVASIKSEASGKYRFVISELPEKEAVPSRTS